MVHRSSVKNFMGSTISCGEINHKTYLGVGVASNPAPIFFGKGENRAWYPLSAHPGLRIPFSPDLEKQDTCLYISAAVNVIT